ncbi:kinase-like domain-containing protein [Syncephalis plumigaleata]|nr:kinase-like domain-containing protein [Syncephalis plumigaleata]
MMTRISRKYAMLTCALVMIAGSNLVSALPRFPAPISFEKPLLQLPTKELNALGIKGLLIEEEVIQEPNLVTGIGYYKDPERNINTNVNIRCVRATSHSEQEARMMQILEQKWPGNNAPVGGHTYIARYLAIAKRDDAYCFVTEYIGKQSIYEYFTKNRVLPSETNKLIRVMALQVVEALVYLRSINISHLNINPANIYMVKGPNNSLITKLTDFSHAKVFTSQTEQLSLVKPADNYFTPPEMFPKAGEPVMTAKATDPDQYDIWQLGVTLYFLGLGKYPYSELGRQVVHASSRYRMAEIAEKASKMNNIEKRKMLFPIVVDTMLETDVRLRPKVSMDLVAKLRI